jgi:predicted transposase/invertase (TIGR01784 family)
VPEYHTETITVSKEHRDYEIIKDVKYHFIELPKFREQKPELSNELECWLALIEYENRELVNMAEQKSPIVKEAKEEFEEILSEGVLKEVQEYEETASYEIASYCHYVEMETRKKMKDEVHDEVKNELKDEVRNEIQEETRTEEKRKIAIEMLNNGLDINIIQKVTKLSLDEIQELQKACKNKI